METGVNEFVRKAFFIAGLALLVIGLSGIVLQLFSFDMSSPDNRYAAVADMATQGFNLLIGLVFVYAGLFNLPSWGTSWARQSVNALSFILALGMGTLIVVFFTAAPQVEAQQLTMVQGQAQQVLSQIPPAPPPDAEKSMTPQQQAQVKQVEQARAQIQKQITDQEALLNRQFRAARIRVGTALGIFSLVFLLLSVLGIRQILSENPVRSAQ